MVIIKMLGGLCMEMFMELQHQEINHFLELDDRVLYLISVIDTILRPIRYNFEIF